MIRNLKVLGIALAAVFALSAVAASMASAQKITSTGPVTLDGTEAGVNSFVGFGGATFSCPGSVDTGHKTLTTKQTEEGKTHELIPSGSTSFTLKLDLPVNCIAVEGGASHRVTVTLNGCDFDVTILNAAGATSSQLVCPTGKDIEIEIYPFKESELGGVACTFTIKPQAAKEGVSLASSSFEEGGVKKWDIKASGAYKKIVATRSGAGCATAEDTNTELNVNLTIKGTNAAGGQTDVTVS